MTKTVTSPDTTIDALPAPPTRSGYLFGGWNTAPDGTGSVFTDSSIVSGGITVYAKWTAQSYTVTFKKNDGTAANHAVKTVVFPASTVTDFPANPTRTGYTFAEWNTAQNGLGSAFTVSTTVSADITVYAQWTPSGPSYTVTFNKNGGDTEASPPTKTVTSPATSIDALPAPPARTGYNFAGWNTQANGSGAAFVQTTTVSSNITVYAQWAHEQFDITLNLDAGDASFSQGSFTLYKNASPGSQTGPITGSGYTNPRWFVGNEFRGTADSITIYAADYSPGDYTLSLIISKNGVSWSKEITFTVVN
jgi:uncharacterized repeat protein (TIGR02543 family)